MKKYGSISAAMLQAITDYGPLTAREMCDYAGTTRIRSSRVVSMLHRQTPRRPKLIHIIRWIKDAEGERNMPRAVYDLGDKPDAQKPRASPAANRRRYLERKAKRVNSIFAMADAIASKNARINSLCKNAKPNRSTCTPTPSSMS